VQARNILKITHPAYNQVESKLKRCIIYLNKVKVIKRSYNKCNLVCRDMNYNYVILRLVFTF